MILYSRYLHTEYIIIIFLIILNPSRNIKVIR